MNYHAIKKKKRREMLAREVLARLEALETERLAAIAREVAAMKKAAAALAEPHGISPEGAEHVAAVLADALRSRADDRDFVYDAILGLANLVTLDENAAAFRHDEKRLDALGDVLEAHGGDEDIATTNEYGETPLMYAVYKNKG